MLKQVQHDKLRELKMTYKFPDGRIRYLQDDKEREGMMAGSLITLPIRTIRDDKDSGWIMVAKLTVARIIACSFVQIVLLKDKSQQSN